MTVKLKQSGSAPSGTSCKLKLYVVGQAPKSLQAFANLIRICNEYLADSYHIEVIDLAKYPQRAKGDQILAIPTVVREMPPPVRKVIGDMSNTERVLVGLDIQACAGPMLASY
jgi:circadian clock protein KaiB